jgi:MFS family permease
MSTSIGTTPRERKLGFRVLFLGMFAIGTGQTLFIAVLPPYARGLGLSTTEIGLIFSLSALGWMFMSPFWGRKSDYVGRKSIILLGLFIYSITTILMGFEFKLHNDGFIGLTLLFILLIITRGFFGFLGSGTHSASMAYVADRTTEKERSGVMALMGSAFAVSGIIGPALASQAILLGPLVPYFLFGSITGVIGILIWIFLPEKTKPNIPAKVHEVRLTVLDSRILTFVAMGFFISQTQAIIMQLLAMYLQDKFNYTVIEATFYTGRVLILMGVATFIVQFFIIRRISPTPGSLLRIGSVFSILSLFAFIFSSNLYYMSLALAVYGIGGALMGPGLFTGVSLAVGKDEQGAAAGILVSAYAAGFVINPLTGMKLFDWNPDFPYFLGIILMIFCLIISILDKRLNIKVDFDEDIGHSGHTG